MYPRPPLFLYVILECWSPAISHEEALSASGFFFSRDYFSFLLSLTPFPFLVCLPASPASPRCGSSKLDVLYLFFSSVNFIPRGVWKNRRDAHQIRRYSLACNPTTPVEYRFCFPVWQGALFFFFFLPSSPPLFDLVPTDTSFPHPPLGYLTCVFARAHGWLFLLVATWVC